MEKIRVTVRIAGKDYTMSGYDQEDYVRRVAMYVDRKLQELSMSTRMPMQDVSVLTSVIIADEMIKAQDESTRLRRELEETRAQLEVAQNQLKMMQAGEDK